MNHDSLRTTLRMTKALADGQRLRILMMLRPGELCVCQIIAVLGLAPSTVSKHLSILTQAGLVDFRKDGRWAYFRLPAPANSLSSQPVYDWLVKSLHDDRQIQSDRKNLSAITSCDPVSVSRRQREGGGVPGGRALPELRIEGASQGRAGSPSTPNGGAPGGRALPELRIGGAPGGRALPELRIEGAPQGRAGSPSTPQGRAGSPSAPNDGAPGGRALPELRQEDARATRRGAPGGRALLPELRKEDGQSGRAGSPCYAKASQDKPSAPHVLCGTPSLPQRHPLPHDIPGWIQGSARFFITINCKQRGVNTLCRQPVAQALLDSVRQYEASGRWYLWLAMLMPDHLHLIVSIRPDLGLRTVIGNWKRYQTTHLGLEWQANFFDHRLRDEDEFRDKALYIRENPVRKQWVARSEDWPYVADRNDGAPGGRALPELRIEGAPQGGAGSPSAPNDGAPGGRALPELSEEDASEGRAGSPSTPNGGAPGGRALPELRIEDASEGGTGSPCYAKASQDKPSTPRNGGNTGETVCEKSKKRCS